MLAFCISQMSSCLVDNFSSLYDLLSDQLLNTLFASVWNEVVPKVAALSNEVYSHWKRRFENHMSQTNEMACAPSEDSDQPGHPPV